MPRIMYDSTNGFDIPEGAGMVLVYVDGIYAWSQEERDRFKHATQVTCSAIGAVPAQVGDVEVGCIWPPSEAVDWVLNARAAGYDPTIYVNEQNDWVPTRQAFAARGVAQPHWWVANYNGVQEIPPGSVGRQYANPSVPPGNPEGPWHTDGHWDESIIADYWPGVDSGAPPEEEAERMYAFDVQEVPASAEVTEHEIVWPPQDGATGVREVWVSGQVPAGSTAVFTYAHWNKADGTRIDGPDGQNYVADSVQLTGPAALAGKLAPAEAAKLVLVYTATKPLKFVVEVRD